MPRRVFFMEKKVDYIIVGFGIAGACFAAQAQARNRSVVVIDSAVKCATRVAAGTLNPVVLKRLTAAWKVQEFFPYAREFYLQLQSKLETPFLKEIPIYRYFHDTEEQNDWLVASDHKQLSSYLDPNVYHFPNKPWDSPMGFGKVLHSMRLDTVGFLEAFKADLQQKESFLEEAFDYDALKALGAEVRYKNCIASKVIFAEGVGVLNNPFFPSHLLIPKKGEYITVKAPNHQLDAILKGKYFYIPLDDETIKVGATFAHGDDTDEITEKGKQELVNAAKSRFSIPIAWSSQVAGKRPTVKDRRPLLGSIAAGSPYYFLNGLGTRGLLLAPSLSKQLLEHIEEGIPLEEEVTIRRFLS